ncbi:N-acetylglucosamine-6-phosphate deacetylase [Moorella sp. Hama-1]|uniref:N-acetylglucosamine-6-phosphate deacetylase n=1 Tax=Moorella sp. Hama-1 TaxID=2138101 RepID=UPI000D65BBF1|nr:amidohydrolase family protein [Moorella sp. Hama-1]BCV22317.1 N-acetylglucosamine-6-phosphate deacetylase [Moorella sp. Hama-1]
MSQKETSFALEGIHYRTGEQVRVWVEGEIIRDVEPLKHSQTAESSWIGPGLVDLQINGYGGMDFNTPPFGEDMVEKVTQALWREGVTSYFPTITTNSDTAIEESVRKLSSAVGADPLLVKTIKGIHLEGPFISPEDGPRGAHPLEHIKPPDWDRFKKWQEAAKGRIKLITLSPEWPGSAEFIAKCVAHGVKVAIGHTAASSEQIFKAVNAGATLSTHLGNGAHPVLPRHPNYIWDQLANERLWTSMIADGFHLPDSVLTVIHKVKQRHAFLVSDSVYLAGLEAGEYETHIGGKVVLTPEGKLHLAENPKLLAGSVKSLRQGIEHLSDRLLSFQTAWEMASLYPSAFMEFASQTGLEVGAPADLVLFERQHNQIKILQTYKAGKRVYSSH